MLKNNNINISILPLSYKTDEKLIRIFLKQISSFLKDCELVVILETDDLIAVSYTHLTLPTRS